MSIDKTEPGREKLDDWQRGRLLDTLPDASDRIDELEVHTRDELGDYVHGLANSVPPGEELKRRELYHWDAVNADHYRKWGKKELIRRICTMELHDDVRLKGKRPPYRQPPPPNPSSQKFEKPAEYNAVVPKYSSGEEPEDGQH